MAHWLEAQPGAQDETVGYHLGEAYRHLAELGRVGERERALAAAAARAPRGRGGAAIMRGDPPAAARLLERAESLLESEDPARIELLPELGGALLDAGRLADADRVLDEAIERARGDARASRRAHASSGSSCASRPGPARRPRTPGGSRTRAARARARTATSSVNAAPWCLRALQAWVEGRSAQADEAWRRAAEHARRAHDEAALFEILAGAPRRPCSAPRRCRRR